jgi:hypothetical protein
MSEQDTSGAEQHPRADDRDEELQESPAPDPVATEADAEDDPEAD